MPTPASDVLADLADAVLNAAVEGLTAAAITVPDRAYIHGGPAATVAWDCDLLAVNLERLEAGGRSGGPGQRNTPPRGPVAPLTALYVCQFVMCYPTVEQAGTGGAVTVPDSADESAAARALYAGAYSARRGIVARVEAGTLTTLQTDQPADTRGIDYERCEVGDLTPNGRSPSGGMAAMQFPVRIRL